MWTTRRGRTVAGRDGDVETAAPRNDELADQRDPIRWLVACGFLLIVAIAIGTAVMIGSFRQDALDASTRDLENDVLLLARHFDQQLDDLEIPLNEFIRQTHLAGIASPEQFDRQMSTAETHQLMQSLVSGAAKIAGMNVYDARGDLINSSEVAVVPAINVADRAYFKALKSTRDPMKPEVELIKSRFSGQWRTLIARAVIGGDGRFLGVVSRAISPEKFEQFFSSVSVGDDATIAIVHHDGALLARYPHIEEMIGKNLRNDDASLDLLSADRSTRQMISPVDGRERLISVRSLNRFPLTVVATTTVASSLADWRAQARLIILAAASSMIVIAITLTLIVTRLTRQHRAAQRRMTLEKNRLDTAIDNMTQGLVLFDRSETLVVCNQQYLEMYGLSSEVAKPGCSFRTLVAHGSGSLIGNVDAHCARTREHVRRGEDMILETPDGRAIQVKYRQVSDGGWAATHEDITKRLRQEQNVSNQAAELARTNMRFEAALGNMTQGLCLFDADRKLVIANSRLREMYDLPDDLLKPGAPFDLLVKFHAERGARNIRRADYGNDGHSPALSQHIVLADGRKFSIKRTPTPDGGWVATHEDVTEQRRQEMLLAEKAAELELTNQRFDAALSNMSQGISMFDQDRRLVVWNSRYAEIYQLPQALLCVGTPQQEIDAYIRTTWKTGGRHSEVPSQGAWETAASIVQPLSRVDELADGRSILVTRRPMSGGGWLKTHEDITERRRAEKEIIHLARHDALTGLANRAEFNARLEDASRRIRTSGAAVTVMMLDLDRFKAVNDTLGHPAGDRLLVEVARRLKASLGESDILARLGGDEFAVIHDGGPDQRGDAIALALGIIAAITEPFDLDGQQATVGTSIGIVLAPEHGVEPEELLKSADLALYSAKAEGRNDFRLFQPAMRELARTQQSDENLLRAAIANEEFQLHYQPVVDIRTRELRGVEALVRWQPPSGGLIAPDRFIPLAEATGLIVPLGDWVLQRACRDAAAWPAHLKVAINISAVQFKKADLFEVVLRALMQSGLEPGRLELEITETALLEDQEPYLATIRRLKTLGISMALDDFGTGYSSINYLTVFPFDKIKIDKSFTKDILTRRDYQAVVASTVALARGLGTTTTAEGVETEEQLDYMREAGVDLVQGYLCGRPVPISEFGKRAAPPILSQLVA